MFFACLVITCLLGFLFLWKNKKQYSRGWLFSFIIVLLLSSILCYQIMEAVPDKMDTVQLTAMNEKSEKSEKTNVAIKKEAVAGDSTVEIVLTEGKWFEQNNNIRWIPPDGDAHPPGLTEKATIGIPVGTSRELKFPADQTGGIVVVEYENWNEAVDLYSQKDRTVNVAIPDSSVQEILINKLAKITVYTVSLLLVLLAYFLLMKKAHSSPNFMPSHWDKIVYAGVALIVFLFMLSIGDRYSFWGDEMYQIGFVHESLTWKEIFKIRLAETSPPLYSLFMAVWYRIVPYGDTWLLLPSMLCTCLGIYLTGLLFSKIRNKQTGVFAVIITAAAYPIIQNIGLEIRSYAFMYFFMVLALYLLAIRYEQKPNEKKSTIFLYGLALFCLSFSHYFGMIATLVLGLADLYLYLKKRISLRCIWSYVIVIIPIIIWVLIMMFKGPISTGVLANFWPDAPTWESIPGVFTYIFGGSAWCIFAFYLGMVLLAKDTGNALIQKITNKKYMMSLQCYIIIAIIGIIYVFSTQINPEGSLFVNRYFLLLMPCMVGIVAYALERVFTFILKHSQPKRQRTVFACICVTLFLVFVPANFIQASEGSVHGNFIAQPFKQAADYLYDQQDIYKPSTATLLTSNTYMLRGWDYYLTKQGQRDPITVYPSNDLESEFLETEIKDQYGTLYIASPSGGIPKKLNAFLKKYYKKIDENKDVKVVKYERKESSEE